MGRPERFLVGHPFNPVYLLPLVEVVAGEHTDARTVEAASAFYSSVGMKPLLVRREIDGFIADRLLEALWREALWLVHDGVATTGEIDDAIRYGPGLRWAQMGTFLTYRIAGGEGGMRHFMSQFGPALQWPWTKLMNVPELTDAFLDIIAAQSDEQADGHSVRELERQRDDNLVGILRALSLQDYAAGAVVRAHEAAHFDRAGANAVEAVDGKRSPPPA
jgi:carnitine 3-dehydrogenase